MKRVPAYIINDLEKLNKHLDKVADLVQDIETWVEKNTDKDSYDFFAKIILTIRMSSILNTPKPNWKESQTEIKSEQPKRCSFLFGVLYRNTQTENKYTIIHNSTEPVNLWRQCGHTTIQNLTHGKSAV